MTADDWVVTGEPINANAPMLDIVVAEDEPSIAAVVSRILTGMGHTARVCSDGARAWAAIEERQPDLLLTDYQMPNMDGFELSTRLKADPRFQTLSVVLVTARGHMLSADDLAKTNIVRVLPKPFGRKDLKRSVDEVAAQILGDAA
ncbi:MAG: response regulator [Planctomycetota bacterium]